MAYWKDTAWFFAADILVEVLRGLISNRYYKLNQTSQMKSCAARSLALGHSLVSYSAPSKITVSWIYRFLMMHLLSAFAQWMILFKSVRLESLKTVTQRMPKIWGKKGRKSLQSCNPLFIKGLQILQLPTYDANIW